MSGDGTIYVAVLANAVLRDGETNYGRTSPLEALEEMPAGAEIVSVGADWSELVSRAKSGSDVTRISVLFACSGTGKIIGEVISNLPNLVWIQGLFAGLDHIQCPELSEAEAAGRVVLTNAKGVFSSSLAEWIMHSAGHFNKDVPRFLANKKKHLWERFTVGELRGSTMGIVGYGSIGEAAARLAKAYGMTVRGCRRRPEQSADDPYLDSIVGMDGLDAVIKQADYLVLAAALTPETEGMLDAARFALCKPGQVFINVGRGKLVDEVALLAALGPDGPLLGAALDVFAVEPLPENSPFWETENVLISCHNADITPGFQHASVRHFAHNCRLFLEGGKAALENVVSAQEGY